MPWSQTSPMDQKTQFIADYLRETLSVTELCDDFGISRKTAYKWIDRYLREGPAGLSDRSRRPQSSPNSTPPELVKAILEARQHHPTWGAKKLLKILHNKHPRWPWPQRSTVCDILKRHGLVAKKRRVRKIGHPGKPTTVVTAPNDLWCADFKGHFRTGNGRYCYPLTVSDQCSRYLLGCQSLLNTSVADSKPVFTRLFKEFGLPTRIRTDNGSPFASTSLARLSRLSAWWVRLGIIPEFTKRSTCKRRPRSMSPHHDRCPINCRRSSIRIASKCAMSAPTAVSDGTLNGSTSRTSASANISASRKSTTASGTSTLAPSNSVACLSDTCESRMLMDA
jgi:putative transposase